MFKLSREAGGLCSVLGQDDLVATDILVRGVNLYNKLLTESFVQRVWPLRSTPCPPRGRESQARLNLTQLVALRGMTFLQAVCPLLKSSNIIIISKCI
jgi:hypothetical protein